jgi:hypothetical protein
LLGQLLLFVVVEWATAKDWLLPLGFGGRMSASADT